MRIFLYEWRKLFQRKAVWIFVVVLLCVNSLFIVREITNNEKGYSLLEVRRVYDDLMHVPESEKMKWLEERLEYLTEQMASRQYDMSGYVYRTYTKTCAQENLLISYVYQQAANQQDYNAYLEYVREQSDQITQLAVFAQPDSYSYRNMLRVKEVYQKLEGVRTVVDFSDGVKLVTDWRWTDVFLLCAIFPLLLNLLVSEREEGTLSLIKPTKNGYSITIWAKIVVMVSLAMLITLLFYGANFMLSWLMVGFGDLGRPIQGLDGYLSSPALMTVGKYLLCFLWAKMIGILTVVCVVGFLCVQMKSSFYTILFSVCISGAEILCWKQIDSRSWIWPLAQFNFASLLDTGSYFSVYENMNLAGYPVNRLLAAGVMSVVVVAFCMAWMVWRFCMEKTVSAGKLCMCARLRRKLSIRGIHMGLWMHECFKLLITGRGLLLLVLFGLLQFGSYYGRSYYMTAEEYEYQNYSEVLEGALYWKKEIFLQKEEEKFNETEQKIEELYTRYAAGEISGTALRLHEDRLQVSGAKKDAFQKVSEQYQKLLEYEGKGEYVEYMEQTGWDALLGAEGRREAMLNGGKLLFVLIMAVLSYFVMEYTTGVDRLQRVSFVGKKKIMLRKQIVCGIYAAMASQIAFLPQIISVWNHYRMVIPAVSVHSVLCLSGIPVAIPLRLWFFLFAFGKMAGAVVFSFLLAGLCSYVMNLLIFPTSGSSAGQHQSI